MARRVLFVDHAPALGGAEVSLLLLLEHLDRTLWQPHLACSPGALADKAAALGIPVHIVPLMCLRRSSRAVWAWWQGARALAGLARRLGAAALVANTVRAALYGALGARLAKVPFVWYMRDFWLSEAAPRYLWLDRMGKRVLSLAAARVIANSNATASQLPGPVTVIHNGIDVSQYDPTTPGDAFRAHYGIPGDVPLVGMIGRLRPWKGQDRFLRVLARVRQKVGVWGVIVGGSLFVVDDDYPARLQGLVTELGLRDCVLFTGQLGDVRPPLAAMDVFVHPGAPEPFGLVNVEAMAMAKPVVAFAHGALPEIVLHRRTGFLVPPGDEEAMAEAILSLVSDPSKRYAMGWAGRERALADFSIERVVAQFSEVLGQIVQR